MRGKWIAIVTLSVLILSGMGFAKTPEKLNFNGTVVGSDGTAIEVAELNLYQMTVDQGTYSYEIQSVAVAKSDTEGKFSFSVDAPDVRGYSLFCCLAKKEGLSCGWATAIAKNEATWTITLGEPAKMTGSVKSPDGTAIADAEVRLVMLSIPGDGIQFMLGIEPIEIFATKTDTDGRFELNYLPADATAEFLVKKPGKGMLHTLDVNMDPETGLTYKAGQTDITLTMLAACKISGKVAVKDGGKGVGGIAMVLQDADIPLNVFRRPVTSAADGSFEFVDMAPGDYKVLAVSNDWIAEPVTVSVTENAEAEATIELTKGGTLEVRVIDSENKETITGVSVNVRDEQTQQYQHFQTDENGFGSKQVLPGTYKVSAYKQGYRSSNEAVSIVVEDGKTATVTVELGGQPKIKGLITDAEGKAIEGATVRLFPNHGPSGNSEIKTDKKGQFTLSWNPGQMGWSEGEFYLLATHSDRKLAGVVQIPDDAKEATIKLAKGITAKGKVVNADGEPIGEARVSLQFHGSRFSSSCGMDTKTNSNGEYEFRPLAVEQRYSVHVSNAKGYGNGRKEISPDSDTKEVPVDDIILQVADQTVTGQVVDIDGKGLADVQLHCYGEGQPNINTKTDTDGKFMLDPVCSGEINISAFSRNGQEYQHGQIRTEGGAEEVKIIVTSRGGGQRFVPKKAASLIGKPLSDLAACGVEVPEDANSILVFVWDMNQRPSRHFMKQLNTKADLLKEKGVTVLLINAALIEQEKLNTWLKDNGIVWPCRVIAEKAEDVTFKMGVQGLPWLILTDAEHAVIAEGFEVQEIEAKLDNIQR